MPIVYSSVIGSQIVYGSKSPEIYQDCGNCGISPWSVYLHDVSFPHVSVYDTHCKPICMRCLKVYKIVRPTDEKIAYMADKIKKKFEVSFELLGRCWRNINLMPSRWKHIICFLLV